MSSSRVSGCADFCYCASYSMRYMCIWIGRYAFSLFLRDVWKLKNTEACLYAPRSTLSGDFPCSGIDVIAFILWKLSWQGDLSLNITR